MCSRSPLPCPAVGLRLLLGMALHEVFFPVSGIASVSLSYLLESLPLLPLVSIGLRPVTGR